MELFNKKNSNNNNSDSDSSNPDDYEPLEYMDKWLQFTPKEDSCKTCGNKEEINFFDLCKECCDKFKKENDTKEKKLMDEWTELINSFIEKENQEEREI